MVDTERFHLGPRTVRVVGAIATAVGSSGPISLLRIATHVPLDVESIARIIDSLAAEGVLELDDEGSLKTFRVVDTEMYAEEAAKVEKGDHLDEAFVQSLVSLLADPDWCRKVRDQHLVLRAAATLGDEFAVDRLTDRVDITPARVRAVLGDFEAEGCVLTSLDADQEMHVDLPKLNYPPERYDRNEALLSHVETRPAPMHRMWWVLLGVAAALLLLFIASRLAMA